jgi:hypothetical protein
VYTKDNGRALAKVSGGKSKTVKLNTEARTKLRLDVNDNIDVLEGDLPGEYYISKAGHGKYGSKMNEDGIFRSSSISSMLRKLGHAFEITDATMEFDGLVWNKLAVVNDIDKADVEKELTDVKEVSTSKF